MNNLIQTFKNDAYVKRYIELKKFIMSRDEYIEALKNELSDNKAKNSTFDGMIVIDEYLEVKKVVNGYLNIIQDVINYELDLAQSNI